MSNKALISLALLIPLFLLTSCGYYTFSGSGLKGVQSVAVPLFEDQTQEYGLREPLTQKLVDAYVQDNTLKVVNQKNSDSILYGIITGYLREAHTFDENENVKEYKIRIFVKVTLEETKKKKIIWEEDNLEGWAIYSAVDETEDDGKEKALEKLAEDIVNRTVKGW
ncbi:MAG: LptE family protein [Candidatus Zixiibacteriota bacterium]